MTYSTRSFGGCYRRHRHARSRCSSGRAPGGTFDPTATWICSFLKIRGCHVTSEVLRYYHALAGLFPAKDIVVYTPEEVKEWSEVPNAFVTAALREGKVLYGDTDRTHRD